MTRRELIKLFCNFGLLTVPFSSKIARAVEEPAVEIPDSKFVLIHDSASRSSPDYRELLEAAGRHFSKHDADWYRELVFWDVQRNAKETQAFIKKYGPNTKVFQWPMLFAISESYNTENEVEVWTVDWLSHRNSLYVEDACYPISGGWWSVDGDWNPTISIVREHLFRSSNHSSGKFEHPWLNLLSRDELQSLHSDHHREMTNTGRVLWKNVNMECPASNVGL